MLDVLLATYKARKAFLVSQIESIEAQDGVEINLIEREDEKGEGACANFAALLKRSRAPYVAFSDQDDVWLKDKLRRELELMRKLEDEYGKDTPILVFTDLRVVNEKLEVLSDSLFVRSRIDPGRIEPRQLAFQNVANGNTILINAALRELAMPIPAGAFMHDHWLVLVAAAFGKIACLNEPTVLYRQHTDNVLGGTKVNLGYYIRRFFEGRNHARERLYRNVRQIEAFVARFGDASPQCFKSIVGLDSKPYLKRVWTILRYRLFKNGLIRNLSTLVVV